MQRAALLGYSRARVERPREYRRAKHPISVVIPCYNYGHYLPACVQSVLSQHGVEVDVLIIDDASTDGSADVARSIAAENNWVRTICHETNKGHIATYNEGLSLATGDYVALLSADDLLTEGSLLRASQLMSAHSSVGLAYGYSVDFADDERRPARTVASSWTIWQGHDWIADRCKSGRNALRSPEAVMRTGVLRELGGYRADLPHAADFEMWMRAATISDVGYIGGADQAYYRVHPNNMHSSVFDVGRIGGIIVDLRERRTCFETVLGDDKNIPAAGRLLDLAHMSLAREALTLAIRSYEWGIADRWPVDELASFAQETCAPARLASLWRALDRRRMIGPRWSRRNPLFVPTEQFHKARHSVDMWRWRCAGV
jgi:glycosyltransferase involved in cell wall biosynthesis